MSSAVETLTARVLRLSGEQPERPALRTDGGDARSYAWLADEVQRCTAGMQAMGVERGTRVLIDAARGEDYIVRLLAGWYAGASVVPLAPGLPAPTEARMLAQLGQAVDLRGRELRSTSAARAPGPVHPSDEAYVFFTSGSSGTPKGVRIAHGGLPQLFQHQADLFRVGSTSRTSWMLAGHFDASISDIGVPLWSGACLAIWSGPERGGPMLDFVGARGLTHIDLPPSQLPGLVARGLPPTLETIVVGGEPAAPDALRAAARLVRVVNVYGPTEATVCASAEVIDPERVDERPNLGRPLPGVGFHLVGGELLISGWGVGLGYLEGPQDAFVKLDTTGALAYRTGDLVEPSEGGNLRFLGRADRQVQLRGQRLELGEIEQALMAAPGVSAAAAVYLDLPAPHVVAFMEGDADAAAGAANSLQDWKRPARIHALDALPRLGNDKVDYAALSRLAGSHAGAVSPSSDPLALAWCQTLGCADALEDDHFFDLGGDSVTALELSIEAARLGVALEPEAIFEHPRLRDLRLALTRGVSVLELQRRSDAACAALDLRVAPVGAKKRGVLLTGSTGMLGLQLLRSGDLDDRPVYAVVRGKTAGHGAERLERLLGAPLAPNVRVLRGDLGLPSLGLSDDSLGELSASVGEVIHAAGAVDLVRSYASLRDVHVTGTGRVMELSARIGARLHHVSTLSVFVESDLAPGVIDESTRLLPEHRIFGGYAQSKWVGDQLAQRYPLGGSVVRLGLLTAEGGAAPPMDQLSRVVRGMAEIGAWPVGRDACSFDVTPVRDAARLIARLLDDSAAAPGAPIHLANATPATGAELRRALGAEGVALEEATAWPPRRKPSEAQHGSSADRAVAMAALTARAHGPQDSNGSVLPRSGDLFLATEHSFDCPTVRSRYPDVLPTAPTHETLRALVRVALESGQPIEVPS